MCQTTCLKMGVVMVYTRAHFMVYIMRVGQSQTMCQATCLHMAHTFHVIASESGRRADIGVSSERVCACVCMCVCVCVCTRARARTRARPFVH